MTGTDFCYIAFRRACGCPVAIALDRDGFGDSVTETLAEWRQMGRDVYPAGPAVTAARPISCIHAHVDRIRAEKGK